MDKKQLPFIIVVLALAFSWPFIDRKIIKPFFPDPPVIEQTGMSGGALDADGSAMPENTALQAAPATAPSVSETTLAAMPKKSQEVVVPGRPEQLVTLQNDHVKLTLSSYGASVLNATLLNYPETNAPDSTPVFLDFSDQPALRYSYLSGLSGGIDYDVQVVSEGSSVRFSRTNADGLELIRTITLSNEYSLQIVDSFANKGPAVISNGTYNIQMGSLQKLPGKAVKGYYSLGVDAMPQLAAQCEYYAQDIPDMFKDAYKATGVYPLSINQKFANSVEWVAAKNKYFVEILQTAQGFSGFDLSASRQLAPNETTPGTSTKMQDVNEISAGGYFAPIYLEPGKTMQQEINFYVGPKKYEILAQLGQDQDQVMEFASTSIFSYFNFFMVPVKVSILWLLNQCYNYIWPHNYGVAIILVTLVIRIVFWPITHKSTESMKKMSQLQPQIKALRDKFKDNPQKLQKATMALYKEHKVSPMGGCLPMVVQIPVFIALFVVLRNAIELRFAHFLWVQDLSQPENLLAGVLPIPLNILPLIMVVTQFIQQKLTPSAGDPQQAKMMQWMPVIFLFFFYTMPSGLVLYWTTNQSSVIVQQLWSRRRDKKKALAAAVAKKA